MAPAFPCSLVVFLFRRGFAIKSMSAEGIKLDACWHVGWRLQMYFGVDVVFWGYGPSNHP